MNNYKTGRKISDAKSGVKLKEKWIKEGRKLERKETKNLKGFIKKLIKLFAIKTSCALQHGGCPCNCCFHSIDDSKTDFRHICWLIVLRLRGDYDNKHILKEIKEELEE